MGQSKVNELDGPSPTAGFTQQNVAGFDVPMHYPSGMGMSQRVEQGQQNFIHLGPGHAAAAGVQVGPVDQLHGQIWAAGGELMIAALCGLG